MTSCEVRDGLRQDGLSRRDNCEIPHAIGGEVLDYRCQNVGFTYARCHVENCLERRRLVVDLVVRGNPEDGCPERILVRLTQLEPRSNRLDAVQINEIGACIHGTHD